VNVPPPFAADLPARGLLVDFGGVLTNPLDPLLREFCRVKGLDEDAITCLMMPGSSFKTELDAFERGEISEPAFTPRFASHLGLAPNEMADMWIDLRLEERMFDVVSHFRSQRVRTCLLSNSWGLDVYPRDRLAEAFDGVVISGEVGMRKPEPAIFCHAAKLIGVEPHSCIVVDDSASNLDGAQAVGMSVVHHLDPESTMTQLERLLRPKPATQTRSGPLATPHKAR
jgi:putative hydrolase of the HAD superfamily